MSEEPKEGEKEKLEETPAEEDTAQKPTEEDEKPQEAEEGEEQTIEKAKEQTGDGNDDEQIEGLHMLINSSFVNFTASSLSHFWILYYPEH